MLWSSHIQLLADDFHQWFWYFAMTRQRGTLIVQIVLQNRMAASFTENDAVMLGQVLEEVTTFHTPAVLKG